MSYLYCSLCLPNNSPVSIFPWHLHFLTLYLTTSGLFPSHHTAHLRYVMTPVLDTIVHINYSIKSNNPNKLENDFSYKTGKLNSISLHWPVQLITRQWLIKPVLDIKKTLYKTWLSNWELLLAYQSQQDEYNDSLKSEY